MRINLKGMIFQLPSPGSSFVTMSIV